MQANSPSPSIDTILASARASTITRNLAFPLRTTVLTFCEGPVTEDPPRVVQSGAFRNMAPLAYVDDADLEGEAQSISDASDDEDVTSMEEKYKTRFWSLFRKLRLMIRRLAHSN